MPRVWPKEKKKSNQLKLPSLEKNTVAEREKVFKVKYKQVCFFFVCLFLFVCLFFCFFCLFGLYHLSPLNSNKQYR